MSQIFHLTCLKPVFSLRKQMLLSFVIPAILAIAVVVSLAVTFAHIAGVEVQSRADRVLREQTKRSFASSSSYVAEQINAYMDSNEGAVQLMIEATRDRIVGYPNAGWEKDEFVPFFDTDSQRNVYPLKTPPPPLDWNFTSNVYPENFAEHFQTRVDAASPAAAIKATTASGVYFFQGSCNPEAAETERDYYPGCTVEHSNVYTGGAIQPTETNKWLHEKSGDLATIFKPILEAQPDVLLAGVYFVNSGAGSTVWYPGHQIVKSSYISEGCDWMQGINPINGKPYATSAEIARCHAKGEEVPIREYNALEWSWFRECVEHTDEFIWTRPFTYLDGQVRVISLCRAIFDRINGNLIGVAKIDTELSGLNSIFRDSRLYDGLSDIAIARFEDGELMSDTLDLTLTSLPKVYETGFIEKEEFDKMKTLFDFSGTNYTRSDVIDVYKNETLETKDGGIVTVFPLPLPPKTYDPSYRPSSMVVHCAPNDVFRATETMDNKINEDFTMIVTVSVLLGAVGMMTVFAIVWGVSRMLTKPLCWIEGVAWSIVNHKDERATSKSLLEADEEIVSAMKCSPRTEITDLVSEFHSMVTSFSGKGAPTVAHPNPSELANTMTWRSDFQQLYAYSAKKTKPFKARAISSGSSSTPTQIEEDTTSEPSGPLTPSLPAVLPPLPVRVIESDGNSGDPNMTVIVPAPPKKNLGGNVIRSQVKSVKDVLQEEKAVAFRSSLFWWILLLIAVPLLLTNTLICGMVSVRIVGTVPDWVTIVKEASIGLEGDSLRSSAYLKAYIAQARFQEISRDLHILTRMAGWLLFDGIEREKALLDMNEATEDCKTYPLGYSCPFFSSGRNVCACEWQDIQTRSCTNYDESVNTRYIQLRYWLSQARDADSSTGTRMYAASFPEWDNMPNRTLWWNTTSELPGAYKGSNASGYETSYDRIRVSSAMAVVDIPVYNYGRELRRPKHDIGTFLGFEADGIFTGYDGCAIDFAFMSWWSSNARNKAYEIAPDICPRGKYGYDARCRDWYATGKRRFMDDDSNLFITAPYVFSADGKLASSATSPIVNPLTGEYVGQVLMDFLPLSIRDALLSLEEKAAFLITPDYDSTGGDTVVGPDRNVAGWESANILDLLFPGTNVSISSANRDDFELTILPKLKQGSSDVTQFRRSNENSTEDDEYLLAYHPVYTSEYRSINPADFSRGIEVLPHLVYIVGIASRVQDMQRPFEEIEDDVITYLERLRTMYIAIAAFVTIVFTVYTCLVNVCITKAVITLLRVVQTINTGRMENELPPLQGGSTEMNRIYDSLTKLIKVVRMSNVAFFSGNLEWAQEIIFDALRLFRKIEDQKACGIACNNLGNCLHAITRETDALGEMRSGSKSNLLDNYGKAMSLFNEAVVIGERVFNEATDEGDKADFAQRLADRLFNRALFSLFSSSNGTAPDGARDLAFQDLGRVQELDDDVKDFLLERKLLLKQSGRCYGRLLRRIHGLIDFYEDKDVISFWNPSKLIAEAEQMLIAAWNQPDAGLFEDLTPVGRLQQLEDAAMRLDILKGRHEDAARLAMRMFAEDELILENSFTSAARSLAEFMRCGASESWNPKTKSNCREDLRRMLRSCKNRSISLGKSVIFAFEVNERLETDPILDKVNECCLHFYDTFCSDEDHVGIVAYTVNGELNVELGKKEDNEGRQRAGLEIATTNTSDRCCPALPYATQMIIDCSASTENDSFIVLVADGYSWDPASFMSVRNQIERLNKERATMVHLFILGLDVEEHDVIDHYKAMCSISKLSTYISLSMANMDSTFRTVGGIISSRPIAAGSSQSLTMEKF